MRLPCSPPALFGPSHAPPPMADHHRLPKAGAEIIPSTMSPRSGAEFAIRKPISVAQTGTPRTKFFVPSIGSMIHSRIEVPDEPNSSPMIESVASLRSIRLRTTSSTILSASLTGVMSGLLVTTKSLAPNRRMLTSSAASASWCASTRSAASSAFRLAS